jgi:outer membrane lipoprotein-sorting protein
MPRRWSTLLLLLLAAPALGADEAMDVLLKALFGNPNADFVGVKQIVLYSGSVAEAIEMEVSCQAEGATRTDYLSPPTMRSRVVIDDGDYLYSFDPHLEITVRSLSPARVERKLSDAQRRELIGDNYVLSLNNGDTIAGRPTYRIEVVSREGFTPNRSLWVDRDKFIVLQSKEECGDSAANSSFTWIRYPDELDDELFAEEQFSGEIVEEQPLSAKASTEELQRRVGIEPVVPPELPGGFILVEQMLTRRDGATYAVHLSYTDGLEGLSVFEEKAGNRSLVGQSITLGGTDLHLNRSANYSVLQWSHGGVTFTLVGQLTRYGLLQIAGALINY